MIRVVLLADTHGHLDARIAKLIPRTDDAVHAGDIGNAEVLKQIQPRTGRVIAVVGNNDLPAKWPAEDRDLLRTLPEHAELALPGGMLAVVHGHRALPAARRHQRLRQQFPYARAVVYGHSHRLALDRDVEPWVLNPGAAGRARTFGGPTCMLLTATETRWSIVVKRFPPTPRNRLQAPPPRL
jgi:putative phosphoesterase